MDEGMPFRKRTVGFLGDHDFPIPLANESLEALYKPHDPYRGERPYENPTPFRGSEQSGDYEAKDSWAKDAAMEEYRKQHLDEIGMESSYAQSRDYDSATGPAGGFFVFDDDRNYYVAYRKPYDSGLIVRKVPREYLGYNILGRAFPFLKVIEIAMDLYGDEEYEVFLHEWNHIRHSEESEYQTRVRTRNDLQKLGKPNRFHREIPWYLR